MYHWKSEALADWLDGDIVVSAANVDSARKKVRKEVERQFLRPGGDRQQTFFQKKLAEFEKDIAEEPEVVEVLFIYGSS